MKIINRSALYIIAAMLVIATASCGKKWKKPTSVSYQFRLNDNSSSGLVKFTSGSLRVKELSFIGDRKQGQNHVEIEKEFEPALNVPLSLVPTSTDVMFEIPQGTYQKIDLGLELEGATGLGASVTLTGYYIKNGNQSIPVKFEYYSMQSLTLPASTSSGNDIVLVEDQPASATLLLNPNAWFQSVPQSMLDEADLTVNWSDSIMIISPSHNEDIYRMVIDRLNEGNEVAF